MCGMGKRQTCGAAGGGANGRMGERGLHPDEVKPGGGGEPETAVPAAAPPTPDAGGSEGSEPVADGEASEAVGLDEQLKRYPDGGAPGGVLAPSAGDDAGEIVPAESVGQVSPVSGAVAGGETTSAAVEVSVQTAGVTAGGTPVGEPVFREIAAGSYRPGDTVPVGAAVKVETPYPAITAAIRSDVRARMAAVSPGVQATEEFVDAVIRSGQRALFCRSQGLEFHQSEDHFYGDADAWALRLLAAADVDELARQRGADEKPDVAIVEAVTEARYRAAVADDPRLRKTGVAPARPSAWRWPDDLPVATADELVEAHDLVRRQSRVPDGGPVNALDVDRMVIAQRLQRLGQALEAAADPDGIVPEAADAVRAALEPLRSGVIGSSLIDRAKRLLGEAVVPQGRLAESLRAQAERDLAASNQAPMSEADLDAAGRPPFAWFLARFMSSEAKKRHATWRPPVAAPSIAANTGRGYTGDPEKI